MIKHYGSFIILLLMLTCSIEPKFSWEQLVFRTAKNEITENLYNFFPKFIMETNNKIITPHIPIPEGFVTFATSNYFEILEILIKSVHAFSTRPVVAYGINADIPWSTAQYPRLIKRRINIPKEYAKVPYIYFLKFAIVLDSNIGKGIYVEADDIVNYAIDELFSECNNIEQFPLCPIHPDDPNDQSHFMNLMGVAKKTNPYVHGHIMFSYNCLPFIYECYQTCLKHGLAIRGNWDETVLNVLMWKYNLENHYLPIYDPWCGTYTSYISQTAITKPLQLVNKPIIYHMFHGATNPTYAKSILVALQKNIGKPLHALQGV